MSRNKREKLGPIVDLYMGDDKRFVTRRRHPTEIGLTVHEVFVPLGNMTFKLIKTQYSQMADIGGGLEHTIYATTNIAMDYEPGTSQDG